MLRDNFLFSKSSLLRYIQCPVSFYLQYCTDYGKIFRKLGEASPHQERGTILHQFFEEFNNGNDLTEIESMLCADKEYANNIMNFYNILTEYKIGRAIKSEEKYVNDEKHVMGFIDAVYEFSDETCDIVMQKFNTDRKRKTKKPESNIAIIDYKTGKYHSYLQRKYEYELNFYVDLIESVTDYKVGYIGMMFTSEPYTFILPVDKRKLNHDIEDFEKQKTSINNNEYKRIHSKLCGYCDFKHICDNYNDDIIEKATETYY